MLQFDLKVLSLKASKNGKPSLVDICHFMTLRNQTAAEAFPRMRSCPTSWTSWLKNCRIPVQLQSVTSMAIPESVILIGDYASANCECLSEVTIIGSVEEIGQHAFKKLLFFDEPPYPLGGAIHWNRCLYRLQVIGKHLAACVFRGTFVWKKPSMMRFWRT